MQDYLIVGCGLAGVALCEELLSRGLTFRVINDGSQNSSRVAGGLYNPIILKRFSLAWEADKQMDASLHLYRRLEEKLGVKLDYRLPIHRIFSEPAEHNRWFDALDDPRKARFMSGELERLEHPGIENPHGVGRLRETGRVDTRILLEAYMSYLDSLGVLRKETFRYEELSPGEDRLEYDGDSYRHVIFCEGFGIKRNPYFHYLPMVGTKGELLIVRAKDFNWDSILKSSVFAIPLGEGRYRLGATYKWKDKTLDPTTESLREIQAKARKFLRVHWEVEEQSAGIRPTVTDRRPLLGTHPLQDRLHIFNGLGSRGVLLAPFLAGPLLEHIEFGRPLHPEVDIRRFPYNNGLAFSS